MPYVRRADNVALAPHSTTVIRMRPTNFTGKFVFHCHVTFHEDHGMMAVVQVVRRLTRAQRAASDVSRHGLQIRSAAQGARWASASTSVRSDQLLCRLLCRTSSSRG